MLFFAGQIAEFLKGSSRSSLISTLLKRLLAKLSLLLSALIVPLLLLVSFLILTTLIFQWSAPHPWDLLAVSLFLYILLSATIAPNSYSLHQFYRDRLSQAFLFHPIDKKRKDKKGDYFELLGDTKLSALQPEYSPYLIINTALNLQGSKSANMRGRGAASFIFTPQYVGSDITSYLPVSDPQNGKKRGIEPCHDHLNLGTAMAISGAAVSSNMGSSSIKLLTPTLTLLNLRLGYWFPNPLKIFKSGCHHNRSFLEKLKYYWHTRNREYMLWEMLGMIDEQAEQVYLTDGGHFENLGLYELIKRGCKFIIVLDGEADPDYSFSSLLRAERYARIDLGARIRVPWQDIATASLQVKKELSSGTLPISMHGPHCAAGTILYADGSCGTILYVKSSMSGDERDYIMDYKRRYPDFPQETTGDQFFSEEQFEAYRWLGFHTMSRALDGQDEIAFDKNNIMGWKTIDDVRERIKKDLCTYR